MDELPFVHNSSFSLNFTQILDYLPNKFLARFLALRAKPMASPTTLDLDSLSPSTISDLMATPEWSTPLSLVSAPQASPKSKLLGAGERSLLFGPLGFFTSGYMLGLFIMASPFVFHLSFTFFLIKCRHSFCTDYITPLFLLGCPGDMLLGVEGCIQVAPLSSSESTTLYFLSTFLAHTHDF